MIKTFMEKKSTKILLKIAKIVFAVIFTIMFLALLINAIISLAAKEKKPVIFGVRFYSIVSDSMEPNIKTGSLITCDPSIKADQIKVGDILT